MSCFLKAIRVILAQTDLDFRTLVLHNKRAFGEKFGNNHTFLFIAIRKAQFAGDQQIGLF
jgi:hypothetical protein